MAVRAACGVRREGPSAATDSSFFLEGDVCSLAGEVVGDASSCA
jgi:hypothetical protein